MRTLRILSVVGARPNFMKIAPFVHAIAVHNERHRSEINGQKLKTDNPELIADNSTPKVFIEHFLVHTGQHYDKAMSESFFESLNIPHPDVDLGIGSGSHAKQVGCTMIEFERVLLEQKPDWVVVVGDVNATAACSITAKKHHVKVAHIEAGLRSFDERMPEEINRLVTDRISDLLLTPDVISSRNLKAEGVAKDKIRFVGNIMIDTLEANRNKVAVLDLNELIQRNLIPSEVGSQTSDASPDLRFFAVEEAVVDRPIFDLCENAFCVLTMHRPSNVDDRAVLEPLVQLFVERISKEMPLVWSVHPRTKNNLQGFGLWDDVLNAENIILINPVGYHEMLQLNMSASIMLTDSGGLQEECSVLGTPCITMRENTERPVTLKDHGGVSVLTGNDPEAIFQAWREMKSSNCVGCRPDLWDGHTAERIVNALVEDMS